MHARVPEWTVPTSCRPQPGVRRVAKGHTTRVLPQSPVIVEHWSRCDCWQDLRGYSLETAIDRLPREAGGATAKARTPGPRFPDRAWAGEVSRMGPWAGLAFGRFLCHPPWLISRRRPLLATRDCATASASGYSVLARADALDSHTRAKVRAVSACQRLRLRMHPFMCSTDGPRIATTAHLKLRLLRHIRPRGEMSGRHALRSERILCARPRPCAPLSPLVGLIIHHAVEHPCSA